MTVLYEVWHSGMGSMTLLREEDFITISGIPLEGMMSAEHGQLKYIWIKTSEK